jgi:SEL1 protein
MQQFYWSKRLVFTIFIFSSLIGYIRLTIVNDKPKRSDEKDNIEPISAESVSPEAQIHLHVDDVPVSTNENNQKTIKDDDNIDELNESLQDLIIEYRIQEQQKMTENNEGEDDDDDDDDDVNLKRILKQIGVSLHNKYREKTNSDQTKSKLSTIIQQLYQTLKKAQPELFTKKSRIDDQSSTTTTDMNSNEEIDEEENEVVEEDEEEEIVALTPEMERANLLFDQANKLINVTFNRQYDTAYKLFKQAADLGHIGAKEELAFAHIIGVHLPMNFNQAIKYFEEGVLTGSAKSHFGLYFMHSVGLASNASISKALVHLTFAAIDGYSPAQMALGYRYWRTVSVAHSCESALMFYKQVATHVSSKMTSASGQLVQRIRLYDEEEHPTQNNIMIDEDLVQYYQLLADRGDAQAQYGLGQLYYLRDTAFDKALYYFRLAAENGNSNAMAYLGKLYSEKNDYIKQNNQTALQFFQRSAEKGNPMGQAGVGMAFYHGAGVEQSYEKAFKYFQLSADQGYVEGQLMLGIMYYNGEGVKRDYKLAIKWFQAASQSGHALGYYNLGQMHATGTGVLRSCATATELFKNVAERGKWTNMFIEAYNLYRQGHIEQAFMKYLYLAELGYEIAQSNVAYLLDQMPNQLINIYRNNNERYKRALIYWNRAAIQGFHTARVKLGDYFYYGYGTEQNYEIAATHYKHATEQSQNPQAMFNLAYMHEKGLGLKRDIHLAKRFYDMAAETSVDAYLPVSIVLFKLHLEFLWENLYSIFSSTPSTPTATTSTNEEQSTIDLDSSWDLYLIAALLGLIGALYTMRRQRIALQQQPPVQPPVQ